MAPLVAVLPILAVALASIAAGVLGDRIGRRNLLIVGAAVFAISGLAPLWLTSFALILVSRAIAGLAIGAMITSAVALTGDYYSGATLQRWLGAQAAASAISGVIVSFASGALGELNWRYAFLPMLMGPLLLIGLLAAPIPRMAKVKTVTNAGPVKDHAADPAPWKTWAVIYTLTIFGTAIIFPPAFELGALLQEKALGSSGLTGAAVAVLAAGSAVAAFSLCGLRRLSAQIKVGAAMASTAIGAVVIANSTTLIPLLAGAALVGVSQGILGPVLSIWLIERTPERWRGRAVGLGLSA